MEGYTVSAARVSCPWFKPRTQVFYTPCFRGAPILSAHSTRYPTLWGFETEAEAWIVCDEHMHRADADRAEAEDEHMTHRGDTEDFHSDG